MIESPPKRTEKFDYGKARYDLLDWSFLEQVANVMAHGEDKYGAGNLPQDLPDGNRRYFAAAIRHLTAYWRGNTFDDKSGLPHLAHAACCIMFLFQIHCKHAGDSQ